MAALKDGSLLQRLLVEAVRDHNVLPLTGRCNLSCCFCSHRYNPPGTRAYTLAASATMNILFRLRKGAGLE